MQSMSGSSSSGNSRVVFSTFSHASPISAQHHPMISHLNQLINTLNEAPQDLMKFQALKEINENLDDFYGTSAYNTLADYLIRVFIKLLQETAPQFIAENNTMQLRKLMLELLYRLSTSDVMKPYSKNLQQILLRIIYSENEEIALLIIKILTDHMKTFCPSFSNELTAFFVQSKAIYNEFFHHCEDETMFLQKPMVTTNKTIEESVIEGLRTCYSTTILSYSQQQPAENYTLIPKASQSVKVLAEMSVFLLVLIQAHRNQLLGEIIDLVPIFVRYINIATPQSISEDKIYNRELVNEFHNSQVRAITFIAYTARQAQMTDIINANSKAISDGIIMLFSSFHDEVVNQRRELLVALKFFFQSEFKTNFINVIPKLCDERALLGTSFASQDQLRNQAYTLLADILHHIRMNLHQLLPQILFLCSRNLHDQQLLAYVQTMYGKLMMNMIQPLMEQGNNQCDLRVFLCSAIDSYVRKAKFLSQVHIPLFIEKYRAPQQHSNSTVASSTLSSGQKINEGKNPSQKHAIAFERSQNYWQDPPLQFSLNDCKNMVRFIIQPTKMMVIGLKQIGIQKDTHYYPMIENLLSDMFLYGLQCLDIFMLGSQPNSTVAALQNKPNSTTNIRSKEEKDTIEAFVAIYTNIDVEIYAKILEKRIEFLVERISANPVLQIICNSFLTNAITMQKMGIILVNFLLNKLPDLGVNNERSNMYLKLFKLIFHTLSSSTNNPDYCDSILKPYLHQIVQRSMQLAISSRESLNYFLLLRALFRSIGSGTHDHLYQQFLPLLPSILQHLNRLQNGSHRQPIHELFVELCLTVPVRLSTLLPYLPLLMDPLVCALNGSSGLVQQGLRTLELCVNNLQSEYFYDHMQPVRSALMKGLWHVVSSGDVQSALVVIRILGKFGGSNRKVLLDAQTLECQLDASSNNAQLYIKFLSTCDEQLPIEQLAINEETNRSINESRIIITCAFEIHELIQKAVAVLRSNNVNTNGLSPDLTKNQATEFLKNFLMTNFQALADFDKSIVNTMKKIQNGSDTKFTNSYIYANKSSRDSLIAAVNGLFIAVFNLETRPQTLPFFKALVKMVTIQAVVESSDELQMKASGNTSMDSLVIIDAIAITLTDACKDNFNTAIFALRLLIDTAAILFNGDKEKASQIILFDYMVEKICLLCYRREWYARLGGCTALRLIIEHYPRNFVQKNSIRLLSACLEVIGLSDELSCGAIDFASQTINILIKTLFQDGGSDNQLVASFIEQLINHIDEPGILHKECIRIIRLISSSANIPISTFLNQSKNKLQLKFAEGIQKFTILSIQAKIAFIEFYLFYSGEEKYLPISIEECMIFAKELLAICDSTEGNDKSDHKVSKEAKFIFNEDEGEINYIKEVSTAGLIQLYPIISGNSADDYIPHAIFKNVLECALKLVEGHNQKKLAIDFIEKVASFHQDYLDHRLQQLITDFNMKKQFISDFFFRKITFLLKQSGKEISTENLNQLNNDLNLIIQTSENSLNITDIECMASAIEFFKTTKFKNSFIVSNLFDFFSKCTATFALKIETLLVPLLDFFSDCLDVIAEKILTKETFCNESAAKFVLNLIASDGGMNLRKALLEKATSIKSLIEELHNPELEPFFELNYLKFLATLFEKQEVNSLSDEQLSIFVSIRALWISQTFQQRHSTGELLLNLEQDQDRIPLKIMDESKFDTPTYCARILITRIRHLLHSTVGVQPNPDSAGTDEPCENENPTECVDLMYELTLAFVHKYASEFTFLRNFINDQIIPELPLKWRRQTFFKVIALLKEDPKNGHSPHTVRFMQHIVAPVFAYAFEIHEMDQVVGPSSLEHPELEDENIVSVLCKEIIQRLTNDRNLMCNSLTIITYLFCSLMVQKCSTHIYDPTKKQQGNRQEQGNLRFFMLLGWPCLQQSFQGDLTEKYAGLFLIANIIDKFSISRTIILQVLNSLMNAYQQDNKELIRKSLDILIPAVPVRMVDGYSQLQVLIKKLMVEESRNTAQIIHCLQVVVRHYKVFYHIRHSIAQLIFNTIQRLLSTQVNFEIKRMVLEICDVVIKWEQERQTFIDEAKDAQQKTTKEASTSQISEVPNVQAHPDLHKQMDSTFIDNIILLLFRIATSSDQPGTTSSGSTVEQINRKAIILLRNALKPNIFGNVVTIRTQFFEKQLQLPNPEQFSAGNEAAINHQLQLVNITLEVLSNIIHHLTSQALLEVFRPLQHSLIQCMGNSNSQQILRSTYNILSKLLEKTKSSATGLDELDELNQYITRSIHEAFNNYASSLASSPPMTIITLLRLMHSAQQAYLETMCLNPFIKLLQRLVREYIVVTHGSSAIDQAQKLIGDLIYICLEVLCTRCKHFNIETQKSIIQIILIPLIEKNAVDKILEIIIKITSEILTSEIMYYRAEQSKMGATKFPCHGAQVIFQLFSAMEARITANLEHKKLFLRALLIIYENQDLLAINLNKISPAFYWGLCINEPTIRNRFFTIYERSFPKEVFHRIMHILCKENWELMGNYFWISHVVHLLLASKYAEINFKNFATFASLGRNIDELEKMDVEIDATNNNNNGNDEEEEKNHNNDNTIEQIEEQSEEPMEGIQEQQSTSIQHATSMEADLSARISFSENTQSDANGLSNETPMEKMIAEIKNGLIKFTDNTQENFSNMLSSIVNIVHADATLCYKIFVQLFISLWEGLTLDEQKQIAAISTPFLTSASMNIQKNSSNSVAKCFLEAFIRCGPTFQLDPFVLYFIGSNHQCWHLALIRLEQLTKGMKIAGDPSLANVNKDHLNEKLEALQTLALFYEQLNEFDQYCSVWKRRAYFEKTIKCLAFYQQGDYIRARDMAEKLMNTLNEKLSKGQSSDNLSSISPAIQSEFLAFENCCINSCKQLNDWVSLEMYANSSEVAEPNILANSLWHLEEWALLKDCLVQLDAAANPKTYVKSTLLKLMLNIANFDQKEFRPDSNEKMLMELNKTLMMEWRNLPQIVSHSHLNILNNMHMTHEVYESANVLHSNVQSINFPSSNISNNLNDSVKQIMKSWRSRPMTNIDQNSSWLDIHTWRSQFFKSILRFYENTDQKSAMSLPAHSLAQSQLQLVRLLRRSNQIDLALNELNKLHSSFLIHPVDIQFKLLEHIKCLLKFSSGDPSSGTRKMAAQDALVEALDMIEGAQFQYLKKEQISNLMVCKGILMNRLDKREEAGRAFSAAAQLDHGDIGMTSVWKHWGEFLTNIFLSNQTEAYALNTGTQAMACILEHIKIVTPQKARASIARLFWLIKVASSFSSDKVAISIDELLEDYVEAVPSINWIFWLNAIMLDVQQRKSSGMLKILKKIGKDYRQQVFYTLLVELGPTKIMNCIQQLIKKKHDLHLLRGSETIVALDSNACPENSMDRLISAFESICEENLTEIDALNQIMECLDNFHIGPIENVLYELKQILGNLHFEQFTRISEQANIAVDPSVIRKISNCINSTLELVQQHDNQQDEELCSQLLSDFEFLCSSKSHQQLSKITSFLRKWIPNLCSHLSATIHDRQNKLTELGTYLSTFKSSMAKIDIFDGYSTWNMNSQCNAQISQFLPIYKQFIKNDSVCRVIRIRSLNGKIYSYQLERMRYDQSKNHVLQMFEILNNEFSKSRNTSQRLIQFAIPKIQFVGQNSRLLSCTPLAGISSQFQNLNSDNSSSNFMLFIDILNEMLKNENGDNTPISPLALVENYYSRLAEQRYSHKTIHELFNQISSGESGTSKLGQSSGRHPITVPQDLLAHWMHTRYTDPTSYWIARKKLAIHFALLGLTEHTFYLSPMTLDGLVLDVSTAQLFFTEYKFDLTKKFCETAAGKMQFIELDANRPVPFRLTPNISNFLDASLEGHLASALTAISRALNPKTLEIWLRPILWDVFSKAAEEDPQINVINPVKRAIDTVLNRIRLISHFENGASATTTNQLLMQAQLPDNLCRMDPGFHPWF